MLTRYVDKMGIPGSVMIRGFFFLKNVQNGFEHRQLEINAATYLAMSVCLRKSRLPAAFPLGRSGAENLDKPLSGISATTKAH